MRTTLHRLLDLADARAHLNNALGRNEELVNYMRATGAEHTPVRCDRLRAELRKGAQLWAALKRVDGLIRDLEGTLG